METETCILGREELLKMLKRQEIFEKGTWAEENLRGAAYDLRVAKDFLVIPYKGEDKKVDKKYKKGELIDKLITLDPGEVAFISTYEKIHMPWTLAGNIGIKFGLARNGLLILTGLIVDPGYGMLKRNGSWEPNKDERIHFLVANLGSEKINLVPGETKIASLQFFRVTEPTQKVEVESGKDMEREFFQDESRQHGLVFVRHIADAMNRIESLEAKLNTTNTSMETLEKGTNQIVMFGVYLVCASILAGVCAFAFSALASQKTRIDGWIGSLSYIICMLSFLAVAGAIVYSALRIPKFTRK